MLAYKAWITLLAFGVETLTKRHFSLYGAKITRATARTKITYKEKYKNAFKTSPKKPTVIISVLTIHNNRLPKIKAGITPYPTATQTAATTFRPYRICSKS